MPFQSRTQLYVPTPSDGAEVKTKFKLIFKFSRISKTAILCIFDVDQRCLQYGSTIIQISEFRFLPRDAMIVLYANALCPSPYASVCPLHATRNSITTTEARSTLATMLPFGATMSKQRSTLSKGRNFNAKLVRHCCRFWQQSRTLLRHCCQKRQQCRSNMRHCSIRQCCFDIVAGVDRS